MLFRSKPVEKTYSLTLYTEQPVETTPAQATLAVPQPLDIEREAGTFAVSADDTLVEVESAPGLRQVNASAGTLFAWRFNARPFSVAARLKRIEPVLETAARHAWEQGLLEKPIASVDELFAPETHAGTQDIPT